MDGYKDYLCSKVICGRESRFSESEPFDTVDVPIEPRPAGCPVPLTAMQFRSWNQVLARGSRLSAMRMVVASVRIVGALNIALLRESVAAVAQRHESLRTRIVEAEGVPRQYIDASSECQFEELDLAILTPSSAEGEARLMVQNFFARKIDLSTGPLFEAQLLKLSEREHVLALGLDHIVSDTTSNAILNREIWTLYDQAMNGQSFSLSSLPVQFADYAVWQKRTYNAWLEKHATYWRARLDDAPSSMKLPFNMQPPIPEKEISERHRVHAMVHFPFGKALSRRLLDISESEGVRLPITVLAVYAALISRSCDVHDFVLKFVTRGRAARPELANMVGLLANHLHFRIEVEEGDRFLDLLSRVNQEFYSACCNNDLDRVPNFAREINTPFHFNWVGTDVTLVSQPGISGRAGPIDIQRFPANTQWPIAFSLVFFESVAGITATVTYQRDLFSRSAIERFGRNLRFFAEGCARQPQATVSSMNVAD